VQQRRSKDWLPRPASDINEREVVVLSQHVEPAGVGGVLRVLVAGVGLQDFEQLLEGVVGYFAVGEC